MGNAQPKYHERNSMCLDKYIKGITSSMESEQFRSVRTDCLELIANICVESNELCDEHTSDLVISAWKLEHKNNPSTFNIFKKNKQYTCECSSRISKISGYVDEIYRYMDPLMPRPL